MGNLNTEIYKEAILIEKIGIRGVQKALSENKKLGIPNVFSKNGKIYYELPNGEITTKSPFNEKDDKIKN